MPKRLTDLIIEKKKPTNRRAFISDTVAPGLYLVIQPSGKKSWVVARRLDGKLVKMFLGHFPEFKVEEARKEAAKYLQAFSRGEDPREVRRVEQTARQANRAETVLAVGEKWLKLDQAEKRTYHETVRFFTNRVVPAWGNRPIKSITKRDCLDLVQTQSSSPARSREVFSWIHRFLQWCVEQDILLYNPMNGAKKERPNFRVRVLNNKELVEVWRASDHLDGDPRRFNTPLKTNQFFQPCPIFGPIIKLLILTGARRQEICGLKWSELDLENGVAILPGERTKRAPDQKHEPRTIYLSEKAREILSKVVPIQGCPFVFSTTGKTPIEGGINKVKERLERLIKKARLEAGIQEDMSEWWLHDLRRTTATNFQKLGVRLEVTETILGHRSGSRSGVVGVYQRYGFETEAREAVEIWADRLEAMLNGRTEDKVLNMARKKVS